MLRAYIRKDDRLVATDVDAAAAEPLAGAAVWYNLTDPTKAEDDFVESCLGIDIPTRAEMDDIEPSRPPLQRGRRRVHDHHGALQFRHRRAAEDADHLRAAQQPARHRPLRRPKAVPPVRAAGHPPHQQRLHLRRKGHARADRGDHRPAGARCSRPPATRSTRSRARCSATRPPTSPARRATCRRSSSGSARRATSSPSPAKAWSRSPGCRAFTRPARSATPRPPRTCARN